MLKGHAIAISMDGKSRWVGNVFVERLWRSVEYEDVSLRAYETPTAVHRVHHPAPPARWCGSGRIATRHISGGAGWQSPWSDSGEGFEWAIARGYSTVASLRVVITIAGMRSRTRASQQKRPARKRLEAALRAFFASSSSPNRRAPAARVPWTSSRTGADYSSGEAGTGRMPGRGAIGSTCVRMQPENSGPMSYAGVPSRDRGQEYRAPVTHR